MHRCPLPVKLVALEELELDLRNYRLPIRVTDERQAVLYMLENEKILELAEEIVKYGYLDNEFPLVVADGSRFKGACQVVCVWGCYMYLSKRSG